MQLKIVAKVDRADRRYFKRVVEPLLQESHVEWIGEISDQDKDRFLGNAYALLFPIESNSPFRGDVTYRQGFIATPMGPSLKLVIKRKVIWKHNAIRTNRANLPPPDSKAVNREIAKDRNVNANSASAKNKAAANRGVVSKADDSLVVVFKKRRENLPAAFYVWVSAE
jgi:hypothetical protein